MPTRKIILERTEELQRFVTSDIDAITAYTALRHAVIDVALDCIIMMDAAGLVVEFNQAAEKTFGYTREEAVGSRLSDLIIPDELRQAHRDGLETYLKTGAHKVLNQRIEVPAVNKSGDKLLVELAISPVEFKGTTYFSAYLRDITDAKAAEEKLRASEERFQLLFDLSPDAIVVIDGTGNIVDVNTRACELAGFDKETLITKNAIEFLPRDQLKKAYSGMEFAASRDTVQVEVEFLNAARARVPTEVVGRRIESPEGSLYLGVVRDISARLAAEQQLRAAKEVAEQANAAKSVFLANMSHEMRTPLNGVIGSLSLVNKDETEPESAKLISAAERSAETLLTLIDDLLDLSRIEAGEVDLELSCFEPGEMASIVDELFGPLAANKQIRLTTQLDAPTEPMRADTGKIRQVLLNLVGNAVKFTQRGEVNVHINYAGGPLGGALEFEISDTGIGISEADLERLFDRFKQVDSSHSKAHGGAGLGLAICKELVEIMNGTITVQSEPGVGSCFRFTVPVTKDCDASPRAPRIDATEERLSGRVLIAEDSETNAMVAKTMLGRLGLDFEHVGDGAAAVDAALNGQFDLILMDVSMPTLDGLEATRILRERNYKKPIIAMTAHALKGDLDHALASGMTGYITKPVRPDAFRLALAKWLPAQRQTTEPPMSGGLDQAAITELWGGDIETFAEIAEIFISELDWRLPGLDEASTDEVEHQAHSLKGASANVGATHLSELAAQLEMAASSDSGRKAELIARIRREADRVCAQLRAEFVEPHHG
ncbi:MAG: PAS domain S-box protein [Hyphomonadaceae bacterium]|nr:PAS domain S-box protein [Hyphomonadaceae bacterium]